MKYIGIVPFIGFAMAFVFILNAEMKPAVKRKAFRWTVILSALSFLIVMPLTGIEIKLLVFALPVLAAMTFIAIKYTKICEWCGAAIQTNLPFVNKERCPKCETSLR